MDTVEGALLAGDRAGELDDIFSFLSSQEREELFPFLEFREWLPSEVVMKTGDPADFMGFLVEGKLAVKMEAIFPDRFILVAVLERGSLVGEIAVVEAGQRHADVVALEKSQLLILSREKMELMLSQTPALGLKLLRQIVHVLGHRLSKASSRLALLL